MKNNFFFCSTEVWHTWHNTAIRHVKIQCLFIPAPSTLLHKYVARVARQHRQKPLMPHVLQMCYTEWTVLACAPIYDKLSFTSGSTANKKLFTAPFPLLCSVNLCDIFTSWEAKSIDRSTLFKVISGLTESNVAALHLIIKITKIITLIQIRNIAVIAHARKKIYMC